MKYAPLKTIDARHLTAEQVNGARWWVHLYNLTTFRKVWHTFYCHGDKGARLRIYERDKTLIVEDPESLAAAELLEAFLNHPDAGKLLEKLEQAKSTMFELFFEIERLAVEERERLVELREAACVPDKPLGNES